MGRHMMRHVTVMAAIVGILVLFGVPWGSAFTFGLIGGCALMMFGMDHSGHSGTDADSTGAKTDQAHQH